MGAGRVEATPPWLHLLFLAAPQVEMKSDPIGRCLEEMQSTNAPNPYSGTFAWAQTISSGDLQGDSEVEEETMARPSSRCEACSRNTSRDRVNWQRTRGGNISDSKCHGIVVANRFCCTILEHVECTTGSDDAPIRKGSGVYKTACVIEEVVSDEFGCQPDSCSGIQYFL